MDLIFIITDIYALRLFHVIKLNGLLDVVPTGLTVIMY